MEETSDIPHTISYAISYRLKINSFNELSKDKRPPRNLWDKPYRLDKYFDEIFEVQGKPRSEKFIDFDPDETE